MLLGSKKRHFTAGGGHAQSLLPSSCLSTTAMRSILRIWALVEVTYLSGFRTRAFEQNNLGVDFNIATSYLRDWQVI